MLAIIFKFIKIQFLKMELKLEIDLKCKQLKKNNTKKSDYR